MRLSPGLRRLRVAFLLALPMAIGPGRAEEPAAKRGSAESSQDAARQFGQKLLGAAGGQLRFDGPIKIEKDEAGAEKALFCVRNSGLEPKAAMVVAGSARSQVGVLAPGEKKCSSVDVSGLAGHPGRQLHIQEHGAW
jgi:hypothetical protein